MEFHDTETTIRFGQYIGTGTNTGKIKLREKYTYTELLWSVFSRIRNEYEEIRSISYLQSECLKIRTSVTPNKDIFYAVQWEVRYELPPELP